MDKEKFEKLAPWLKNEIKLLENKIKNLEGIIKTLSLENNEQTNIFLEKEGVKKYIPNKEIIYFLISNEELNVWVIIYILTINILFLSNNKYNCNNKIYRNLKRLNFKIKL